MPEENTNLTKGATVVALYDFSAQKEDEMSLEEDDIVTVLDVGEDGWILGQVNENTGWFPANHVQLAALLVKPGPEVVEESNTFAAQALVNPPLIDKFRINEMKPIDAVEVLDDQLAITSLYTQDSDPEHQSKGKVAPVLFDEAKAVREGSKEENLQVDIIALEKPSSVLKRKRWSELNSAHASKMTKAEINRQEVIMELIKTERDYVTDLEGVIEVFLKPMKKESMVSEKDISVLFSNLEQILPINSELAKKLEERANQGPIVSQIGDIFLEISDYLKIYTLYCSNHPYAVMKMQSITSKVFHKFLETCAADPKFRHMELSSFLIKPVQRICKYPLLIREIIKNTDENHPDRKNLEQAMHKIETVVTIVNEAARKTESVYRMLSIQSKLTNKTAIVSPSRYLTKEGDIKIIKQSKSPKNRKLYLFNDLVLITKEQRVGDKQKIAAYLPISQVSIFKHEKQNIEMFRNMKQKYMLVFDSESIRDDWLKEFEKQIQNKRHRNDDVIPENIAKTVIQDADAIIDLGQVREQFKSPKKEMTRSEADLSSKRVLVMFPESEKRSQMRNSLPQLPLLPTAIKTQQAKPSLASLKEVEELKSSLNLDKTDRERTLQAAREQYKDKRAQLLANLVNTPIKQIKIVDVFRQVNTKKDYIYVVSIERVGADFIIFLSFEDFFDFHLQLLSHFPEEAGVGKAASRIIPDFPGQCMFVSETLAIERIKLLQDYMGIVLGLPPRVSRSYVVSNFLKNDGKRIQNLLAMQSAKPKISTR